MPIKVLTIDDDPGMTTLLRLFLEGDTFEVFIANSSIKGVEAVRNLNPDIVLLDLMMPELDGWEVCRQIRTFSQVPILILSVITEEKQLVQVINDGATDFMSKPIIKDQLISRLLKLTSVSNIPQKNCRL